MRDKEGGKTSWKMCPFCWRFLSFRIRKNWWPLIYFSNNKYFLHIHLEVEPGADLGGGACAFDWWGSKWGKGLTFDPLLHLEPVWPLIQFYFLHCFLIIPLQHCPENCLVAVSLSKWPLLKAAFLLWCVFMQLLYTHTHTHAAIMNVLLINGHLY